MRHSQPFALVTVLATVAAAQTAPTSAPVAQVDNPPYVAWAKCQPGTGIDATMTGTQGGRTMTLSMNSTLDRVTPEKAVVSTTIAMPNMPAQTRPTDVAAKVDADAVYNPQKIPGLTRTVVGNEVVAVDGKPYACSVIEFTGNVQAADVKIRVWETMDIPGGFAKLHATIGPNQMSVEVQKIRAKP